MYIFTKFHTIFSLIAHIAHFNYNCRMKNTQNNELAVCGLAAVKKLEKNNPEKIRRLYFTKEVAPLFGGLCKKLAQQRGIYNMVDPIALEKLSGTVHHQGVVAMIFMPEIQPLDSDITELWIENGENALVLDRIGNANNFGAIVRSAAFFGIENIVIPNDEAQSSVTTSSYRIAEGGMEYVRIYSANSIARLLEAMKGKMLRIGTDLKARKPVGTLASENSFASARQSASGDRFASGNHSASADRFANSNQSAHAAPQNRGKPFILVLGNEENGISNDVRKNCDELVIIPFAGMKNGKREPVVDSLNVAQAASVLLYELCAR